MQFSFKIYILINRDFKIDAFLLSCLQLSVNYCHVLQVTKKYKHIWSKLT